MRIAEDTGDVINSKGQIVRKLLSERKTDERKLWEEENKAEDDNQYNCSPVKSFSCL
jgi:hypothetical protein